VLAPRLPAAPSRTPPGPPTGLGAPGAAPPTYSDADLRPVAPQSHTTDGRRRRPVLLIAAVLAVLAVGIGAIVAFAGGGEDGSDPQYSLAAAAQQAANARTMTFEFTVSMGSSVSMSMDGAVDADAQLMTMTMDASGMLGGTDGPTEMILDLAGGVVYMRGTGVPADVLGSASWVSMDLEELAASGGLPLDELREQLGPDPGASAGLLLDDDVLDTMTEIGVEEIDGEVLMRYQVSVAGADVLAANPQLQQQIEDLPELADIYPETIVYDVWVTDGDELRMLAFEMPLLGETMRAEMVMRAVGEPIEVRIPSGDQVVDMTGLPES
jgi:hypothetical protein